MTSLWLARNTCVLNKSKKQTDFSKHLQEHGYSDAVIMGSALMHYSMKKAGSLLGLGPKNPIKIPLNSSGTIDTKELSKSIKDCRANQKLIVALVGIGGSTETGSVDDLVSMADIAEQENIHFHVDAAWGGHMMFSQTHKKILKGIERADTVTIGTIWIKPTLNCRGSNYWMATV